MDGTRSTGAPRLYLVKPDSSERRLGARVTHTVLVVEDEDSIREFLRSALESEGYFVVAAADGAEALDICQHVRPDLILLDLMMPRLDGLGFLHEFRRRSATADVPIYLMSAVRTAADHAQAAGVSGVFLKPFDLDDLLDTVDRALRQSVGVSGNAGAQRPSAGHGHLAGGRQ
jgi:CheY-like chemotaxis protein